MFDPISLAVGAGLVGAGWVFGRMSRRNRVAAVEKSPAPCGCGHDLAVHDRESGVCHAEFSRKANGMREWVRCPCHRYTGPTPLDEFFTPQALPPIG
ncbi:hypothetical protein IU500_21155 [Nocardia terpenica]|uniref:Uncharacterized protein n=1 Tax=Nocardia terpenica TaxID=455432 RepID=A0A161XHX3_9NOCA|nr:hypothetical protein [Nocardia terpenica]KZM73198.1 hypothetical protein AWN90_31420 [Nocardia terpenica]MBF6064213.1 hypothetical protein [Nocardia terpenica]MBF6106546.1 hypothetical protein [Nocardia terpenica]MBF6113831.1 hypothetical protein [Nocardia terpenica]MBF6120545.1 hypothetical protein [Nocardia terpenica]